MSFTAAYSELQALDLDAGEQRDHAPRILDPDGWTEATWAEVPNLSPDAVDRLAVTGTWTDSDAYPTEEWRVLKGFKTHRVSGSPLTDEPLGKVVSDDETSLLGLTYNIERVGIPYESRDGGVWKALFAAVSQYTEPFACHHSPRAHSFPDVTDFDDGEAAVYYIEAVDGDVYAEEQSFARIDTTTLVADHDRVADPVTLDSPTTAGSTDSDSTES